MDCVNCKAKNDIIAALAMVLVFVLAAVIFLAAKAEDDFIAKNELIRKLETK